MTELIDWLAEVSEKLGFSSEDPGGSAPAEPGGGTSGVTPSPGGGARVVPGGGGYVYAQSPDGEIVIKESPTGQTDLPVKRGSKAWKAITAEIGPYPGSGAGSDPGSGGDPGAGADPAGGGSESGLAGQIRAAVDAGGINIAIYMIGDPDKNNDKEFKRQAKKWAGNHGAFGLSGSSVKKDHAMSLSRDPGKLVSDLLAAMQAELGNGQDVPIANVALFTHGGSRSMQINSRGSGGGEGWVGASSNVVKDFSAAVKPALTAGAKIHLFACTAAKDRDPTKDADDPTRRDSFAEDLQELTGAEVWGHENAAHTTGNSRLVMVDDEDADANAERYQIRDVLAKKFFRHVDSSLTESQMGYLDGELEIAKWIKSSLRFKGSGSSLRDRHQVFVEEISMMGFDELFDLLIASSAPSASTFRSLFPEHDQIDKLVEGGAAVHAQFHKEMDEKKKAIEDAKGQPGFPAAAP